MVGVTIDGLLAHDDGVGLLAFDDLRERTGHEVTIELLVVRVDADRFVSARCQRTAKRGLGLDRAEGDDDDLSCTRLRLLAVFGQSKSRLESVFIERIRLPLQLPSVDPVGGRRDFHLVGVVGVGDALERHQDLHGWVCSLCWTAALGKRRSTDKIVALRQGEGPARADRGRRVFSPPLC